VPPSFYIHVDSTRQDEDKTKHEQDKAINKKTSPRQRQDHDKDKSRSLPRDKTKLLISQRVPKIRRDKHDKTGQERPRRKHSNEKIPTQDMKRKEKTREKNGKQGKRRQVET
jgi:hypothetical protein